MSCDLTLERLPDFVLGTLDELESAEVRRHLRGCGGCRTEAARLDRGLALYAGAAHAVEPPPELRARVMTALAEEWAAADPEPADPLPARPPSARFGRARPGGSRSHVSRWLAVAAAIAVAAAVTWALTAEHRATNAQAAIAGYQRSAESYQNFLHALGGKDVRAAVLQPVPGAGVRGNAVVYDSDRGQSWVGVIVHAPGKAGPLQAVLSSASGARWWLKPIQLNGRGDGSTWMVTAANLSGFSTVQVRAADGTLLAQGAVNR